MMLPFILFALAALAGAGPSHAGAALAGLCLSTSDATAAVAAQEAVAPGRALGMARRTVPGAAVLRAALCRNPDALVYRITMLAGDGRLVRVEVDAPTGTVKAVH